MFITFARVFFMKKEIILLLSLLFLGCQNKIKINSLIDLVPADPLLIINYKSNSNVENFNQNFNTLINIKIDSVSKKYRNGEILISYHKIGKKNIVPVYFTSIDNTKHEETIDTIFYDGSLIKRVGGKNKYKYSTQKNNIHIESTSKLLVENSIRKSNQVFKIPNKELRKLYDISNSEISLLISENIKDYLDNKKLFSFFNISKLSNWIQYDIDLNQNGLTLNGLAFLNDSVPKNISYLNGIKPSKSNFIQIIPNSFSDFQRTGFNYYKYLENFENNESITKINEYKNDSLLIEINEFGILKNKLDTILLVNFEDKIFLNKEIIKVSESDYDYRNYKIYKLKKSIINYKNLKFIDVNLKQNYASIIDNNLVISNTNNNLERIIINISNSSTINKESINIKFAS